jgi:hypothetical protein
VLLGGKAIEISRKCPIWPTHIFAYVICIFIDGKRIVTGRDLRVAARRHAAKSTL